MDELSILEQQIEQLKAQLHQLETKRNQLLSLKPILTPEEKINIFSDYFKGNTQCYAIRWQNKEGRSGYAIACNNEWQQGVCLKPKIKCLECTNQSFKPLDHQAIYDHLIGKKIIGIYPLLSNDTCHFLAIDLDKSDWKEAALAYATACRNNNIDCLIERSRSGNGAHVWIFFSEAIKAKDARLLGFTLLDLAMSIHGGLSFESYDRFFPNQDYLPIAGIGNLIALPLQKSARMNGNSQFVDENFVALTDQWQALQSTKKLEPSSVLELIEKHSSSSFMNTAETINVKPWEYHQKEEKSVISGCPSELEVTLSNRIFIPTKTLPNSLTNTLKKLASFSNPHFFKTRALRLSTNGIPRFISLAEYDQGYLSLPRGCFDSMAQILEHQNITLNLVDKRYQGRSINRVKFIGDLREDQKIAVETMLKFDFGVMEAPTAFGKTVTAIGVIAERKVNTLILVHSKQLAEQWRIRLQTFLTEIEIGSFTGSKKCPSGQIDVATYQCLLNRNDNTINPIAHEYGQVIIDECHHLSSPQYERLVNDIHAKYILGISATLERRDGHQPIIFMLAGDIRHCIKKSSNFTQQLLKQEVTTVLPTGHIDIEDKPHIADIYRWLMNDNNRNQQIMDAITIELKLNRNPIVLTERREHAKLLSQLLSERHIEHVVLLGTSKKSQLEEKIKQAESSRIIIATSRFVGEGFDLPRLDTLLLTLPISWKGNLTQYIGRIQRDSPNKEVVKVIDFVDINHPILVKMFNNRKKCYTALGFTETSLQASLL
ncbi:TOTE conflict system archaeo-eukaryotic primase domain-containing protein [Photobacterium leiognathi]|uniref:TOTE conflict system archaeo-eukaryotic primase domain-containing protein n=1 Tax=Photobacterium leiognathi TaxID=553611 RepID=UPI0029813A53|nr:DEAD/DEAH box helicase family protein [Photobacterium leiognathi]